RSSGASLEGWVGSANLAARPRPLPPTPPPNPEPARAKSTVERAPAAARAPVAGRVPAAARPAVARAALATQKRGRTQRQGQRGAPSELVPEARDPSAPRSTPAHPPEIDPSATIEPDSLAFQQIALELGPGTVAMAAAARRVDHPLPGNETEEQSPEGAERHSDRPGAARLPEDRRHLAVGDDPSARHSPYQAVDE